jgi:hexosaminidase
MKFYSFLLTILSVALITHLTAQKSPANPEQLTLMPVPAQLELGVGIFRLDKEFTVAVKGPASDRAYNAATRMLRRLSGRTGLFLTQDFIGPDDIAGDAPCRISWGQEGKVELGVDESYTLDITPEGIHLAAETDIGVLRGLETLLQLLRADQAGYFFPTISITDAPRFPWRGLLIDACRHFMPVEVIKRNMDGMAAVKLNVLHWHLSENQGFRVECKAWPRLHELGSDGMYYTQAQIREVLQYADERGIRVMPEFDIPGHSTSWLVAYPELAAAPGPYTIDRRWGILDPTMDPTSEELYDFLDAFFKEMTALFPDEYWHIGGDEVNGVQWDANEDIQAFIKNNGLEDNHGLQAYFNRRVLELLTRYDKRMVGWDEIFHPDIPNSIVIHSWRGKQALMEAARKGYQSILSNGYYIDMIYPAEMHYLNDPLPPDSNLTPEQAANILGGEATMWAELVTPENVDSRIWPRLAVIAERLWSPAEVTDVDDMYRRLVTVSLQQEELGLQHEKNFDMMLRRLTNGADTQALRILMGVVEPLKVYTRHRQPWRYYSYSPLTRVVDAARPDAPDAREFRRLVDRYLEAREADTKAPEEARKIKAWLELWQDNHDLLKVTIAQSPILKEIESTSEDLTAISAVGTDALKYLEKGKRAKSPWVAQQRKVLEEAQTQPSEVELMVLPTIDKMVLAAGGEFPE